MEHRLVAGVGERTQDSPLVGRRIGQEPKRFVGVGGDDGAVEPPRRITVDHDGDAVRVPLERDHGRAKVEASSNPREDRAHLFAAPADDGLPAAPAKAEHPVIVEEANRIGGRDVERPLRGRRPDGGGQRDEVVVTELAGVSLARDVALERGVDVARVVAHAAGVPQEADDVAEHPQEARVGCVPGLREGTPTGPLDPAAAAADRERHLRILGAEPELAEEPNEVRVVRLVVDDETGVEPKLPARRTRR